MVTEEVGTREAGGTLMFIFDSSWASATCAKISQI